MLLALKVRNSLVPFALSATTSFCQRVLPSCPAAQFFKEAHECEQWLQRVEEKLNTTFSRHSFSMDEGERLLRQMQELREDLARYAAIVNSLLDRSHEVLPLKQRRAPLPRPLRVTAVCTYNQLNVSPCCSSALKWGLVTGPF